MALKADAVKAEDVAGAKAIITGSYCMRDQCSGKIDESIASLQATDVKNKPGAAFGTYKFSGAQVKLLEEEMARLQIILVSEGVNSKGLPDSETAEKLRVPGKKAGGVITGNSAGAVMVSSDTPISTDAKAKPAENHGNRPEGRWICLPCDYIYDPATGDPDHGIARV